MTQIRCPVCNGCGAVEAWFGSGIKPENLQNLKEKECPACHGTGIQTIFDYSLLPAPPEKEKWAVYGGYPSTTGGNP